jgi:hypothetical protein
LELSYKARYQITQAQSGPEAFASVPWSFLTKPDINSHTQGPTAGSDTSPSGFKFRALYLLGKHFIIWPKPLDLCALVCFSDKVLCFCPGWPWTAVLLPLPSK